MAILNLLIWVTDETVCCYRLVSKWRQRHKRLLMQ